MKRIGIAVMIVISLMFTGNVKLYAVDNAALPERVFASLAGAMGISFNSEEEVFHGYNEMPDIVKLEIEKVINEYEQGPVVRRDGDIVRVANMSDIKDTDDLILDFDIGYLMGYVFNPIAESFRWLNVTSTTVDNSNIYGYDEGLMAPVYIGGRCLIYNTNEDVVKILNDNYNLNLGNIWGLPMRFSVPVTDTKDYTGSIYSVSYGGIYEVKIYRAEIQGNDDFIDWQVGTQLWAKTLDMQEVSVKQSFIADLELENFLTTLDEAVLKLYSLGGVGAGESIGIMIPSSIHSAVGINAESVIVVVPDDIPIYNPKPIEPPVGPSKPPVKPPVVTPSPEPEVPSIPDPVVPSTPPISDSGDVGAPNLVSGSGSGPDSRLSGGKITVEEDEKVKDSKEDAGSVLDGEKFVITFDYQGAKEMNPVRKLVETGGGMKNLPYPVRPGYGFGGWYSAADGKGTWYTSGTGGIDGENLTLYAYWIPNMPNLVFHYNCADGEIKISGKKTTVGMPVNKLPIPERESYEFMGWYTLPDGKGEEFIEDTIFNFKGTVHLYAYWE